MTTTRDMAKLLRALADRFDTEFKEGLEVACTLTVLGFEGPHSAFPIDSISAREDTSAGVVIVDFECPQPAGDLIRSMLMSECGRLIQMAADADIERVKSRVKVKTVNIKSKGDDDKKQGKVVMH